MKYQEIMAQWDAESGISPAQRAEAITSYEDAAQDAANPGWDSPEAWIADLEADDAAATLRGRLCWGLAPLV